MYIVTLYNYKDKTSNVLLKASKREALAYIESYAYDYILNNQGKSLTNKEYDYYVFEHNKEPKLNRYYDSIPFYILKSEPSKNINKIKIKQKIKEYGYIKNTYKTINHISLYLFKYKDYEIYDEDRTIYFENFDLYDSLMKELLINKKEEIIE